MKEATRGGFHSELDTISYYDRSGTENNPTKKICLIPHQLD